MELGLAEAGIAVVTLSSDHGCDTGEAGLVPTGHPQVERVLIRKRTNFYKVAPGMLPWLNANVCAFDLVHIHALFSFAPTAAAWIARARGVPYIIRPLGTLAHYGMTERRQFLKRISVNLIERSILSHAAAVHFTSISELEEARDLGLEFNGVVIPIGIEPADRGLWLDKGASQTLTPIQPILMGRRIVLFLSRIDPKKNLEALIDAFGTSELLRTRCALLIAGSGDPDYVACLQARSREKGIEHMTCWLGHVDGVEKAEVLAAASVFVLPSFAENFGIAAVEAMRAGVPCLLGEGVAVSREVVAGGAGLAVPPRIDAVRRGLEHLMSNPAGLQEMGIRARELATREYSLLSMTQRLVALYESSRKSTKLSAA
jgi:glycosyltransferase involved in cell wall biosynthesis